MRVSTLGWFQLLCLFATCLVSLVAPCRAAVDPASLPKPTGYVSDLANVVSPSDKQQLEEFATRVESELGVQLAFVTVDSTGDVNIRDFALQVFRTWGVGAKKTNQGVLLLLAVKDRKSDLETGRGIEPYLTDGFSGSILRSMRPDLRNEQYGAALNTAAHTMAQQIAQGKNIAFADQAAPDLGPRDDDREPVRRRGSGGGFPLFIVGIFVLLWLLSRGGRRGGGGRWGGGGGSGNFLTGMLLGNLLGGRGSYGGGNWGGGGGFGGGDSGGGGGFGGFGGGDAGGGGASSDW